MGVSNFFYQGAKTVQKFVKAKLKLPNRPAATKETATFVDIEKTVEKPSKE